MSKAQSLRQAAKAMDDHKSDQCGSCNTIILSGEYCSDCKMYWDSVESDWGLEG